MFIGETNVCLTGESAGKPWKAAAQQPIASVRNQETGRGPATRCSMSSDESE